MCKFLWPSQKSWTLAATALLFVSILFDKQILWKSFFFPDTFFLVKITQVKKNSNKDPVIWRKIWIWSKNSVKSQRDVGLPSLFVMEVLSTMERGEFYPFLSQFSGFFHGWHWCQIKAEIRLSPWPAHEATTYLAFNWEILSWVWTFSRVFSVKKGKKNLLCRRRRRRSSRATILVPCCTEFWPL